MLMLLHGLHVNNVAPLHPGGIGSTMGAPTGEPEREEQAGRDEERPGRRVVVVHGRPEHAAAAARGVQRIMHAAELGGARRRRAPAVCAALRARSHLARKRELASKWESASAGIDL